MRNNVGKRILSDFLGFLKYKVDNDLLTMEDIESLARSVEENVKLYGTIGEFSDYYGKSKDAVNSVIKRRMIEKPRRNVVLYPFHVFRRIVPESWLKNH